MPSAPSALERIDTVWTRRDRGATITFGVTTPAGLSVRRVEIHFRQTAVPLVPVAVDVYGVEGTARARLNEGLSGQWLESLAADALVRRESPVATVRLLASRALVSWSWSGSTRPIHQSSASCSSVNVLIRPPDPWPS